MIISFISSMIIEHSITITPAWVSYFHQSSKNFHLVTGWFERRKTFSCFDRVEQKKGQSKRSGDSVNEKMFTPMMCVRPNTGCLSKSFTSSKNEKITFFYCSFSRYLMASKDLNLFGFQRKKKFCSTIKCLYRCWFIKISWWQCSFNTCASH